MSLNWISYCTSLFNILVICVIRDDNFNYGSGRASITSLLDTAARLNQHDNINVIFNKFRNEMDIVMESTNYESDHCPPC